jgi:hypothetical protein
VPSAPVLSTPELTSTPKGQYFLHGTPYVFRREPAGEKERPVHAAEQLPVKTCSVPAGAAVQENAVCRAPARLFQVAGRTDRKRLQDLRARTQPAQGFYIGVILVPVELDHVDGAFLYERGRKGGRIVPEDADGADAGIQRGTQTVCSGSGETVRGLLSANTKPA